MKNFQSLNDPLFQNSALSSESLRNVYGGDHPTTVTATTVNCATYTYVDATHTDSCDTQTDRVAINDKDDPPAF